MTAEHRKILVDRIKVQGFPSSGNPLPLATLEEFFTGNDDYGSIGCNLSPLLGPQYFYEKLKEIRDRSNVHDVLIEITEVIEEDPTTWPFSDSVYVFTNATHDEVADWAVALQPDAVEEGFTNGKPSHVMDLPPGVGAYRLWWD